MYITACYSTHIFLSARVANRSGPFVGLTMECHHRPCVSCARDPDCIVGIEDCKYRVIGYTAYRCVPEKMEGAIITTKIDQLATLTGRNPPEEDSNNAHQSNNLNRATLFAPASRGDCAGELTLALHTVSTRCLAQSHSCHSSDDHTDGQNSERNTNTHLSFSLFHADSLVVIRPHLHRRALRNLLRESST